MSMNYAYNYAEIDPDTKMCVGVMSTTTADDDKVDPTLIVIPVYDEEYICKYYICNTHTEFVNTCTCGAWYEDADGTIPWTSALL